MVFLAKNKGYFRYWSVALGKYKARQYLTENAMYKQSKIQNFTTDHTLLKIIDATMQQSFVNCVLT
jgi:hypothetical protein